VNVLKDIKILESVFKSDSKSYGNIIFPVSAGAVVYNKNDIALSMRDDEGDNISDKNSSYCELTVQYWAWKNLQCEVCGIFHQRRFLDFSGINKRYPYRIAKQPDEMTLQKAGLSYQAVCELTDKYSVIANRSENLYESVEAFYNRNDRQNFDDIGLLKDIIREKYSEYYPSAEKYFNGTYSYFCNVFIMDKKNFDNYSEWLFNILFEYEKRKPENLFYPREMGKLGERLFGVYMTYIKDNTDISYTELPRIHFSSINGTTMKNLSFNKYLYYICPPGTKRRAFLRKLKK
jgi:hypothetical protein